MLFSRLTQWSLLLCMLNIPLAFAATPVEVVKPETASQSQQITLTGTVEAKHHAQLAALQAGLVDKILVDIGDTVSAGQKLMLLDATLAKLDLAEAQATVESARVDLQEAQRLYKEVVALSKQQLVAETLIGERRAAVARAKSQLTRQQSALAVQKEVVKRQTLYAPFDGVIASRGVNLGEWVTQQSSLFTLVDQRHLRVKISIPQEYYRQLVNQSAIEVQVQPDLAGVQPINTSVSRLVRVSDQQSRTLSAYIDLPEDTGLVVGMSALVNITLSADSDTLLWLPKGAIKQHPDGGLSVFAIENNRAKRYLVKQVSQRGNQIAVSGAPANVSYVATGVELLTDGTEVQAKGVAQ